MGDDIKLYSLFYADAASRRHANLSSAAGGDIEAYLRCGVTLARSCRHFGVPYAIITNNKPTVDAHLLRCGTPVETLQIPFDLDVPDEAAFFAAHFKLDVFRAFGDGRFGSLVGLIDIDMVMLRRPVLPPCTERTMLVYDLAEPTRRCFGETRVVGDLRRVGGPDAPAAYWYGGEFIAATPVVFRELDVEIRRLWPRYRSHMNTLHHVGDEMIVSAAIAGLQRQGVTIKDVGRDKTVARWWTARTGFEQAPFRTVADSALLHLPSDKPFLGSRSEMAFDPTDFLDAYRAYARDKLARRRLINPLLNLLRGERKFAGRL